MIKNKTNSNKKKRPNLKYEKIEGRWNWKKNLILWVISNKINSNKKRWAKSKRKKN
jgi:hypothetical protein